MRPIFRSLARRPGFSLLAIAALGLGVGGATAVYSLVHHVLLEGLPFPAAERLVTPDVRSPQGHLISISIPNYRDWGARSRSFEAWGGSAGWGFIRPDAEGGSEILDARLVIGDFFDVLGMRPALGRLLTAAETEPGSPANVVLGHAFWRRAYGGAADVVGRPLVLDGFTATVVGVLPEGVGYPSPATEVYAPMGVDGSLPWEDRNSSFGTRALGRLAEGVTVEAAQADLARVAAELEAEVGEAVSRPELRRLDDLFLGPVRTGLWVLMGAVALLLLIACANVASLALARGEGRGGELAVRTALGAGRHRLVGLLLGESVVVAAAGGLAGVAVSALAVRVIPALLPLDIPALVAGRIALDGPVLLFALGVSALSALLFGLVPALRLGGAAEATRLRQSQRTGAGREARRIRDALVVTQVALTLVLLVAAGLLARSLARLAGVDKGFVAENVLTARLQPREDVFETPDARWAFYDAVLADLEAAPDVRSAGGTLLIPLVQRSWERLAGAEGASLEHEDMTSILWNVVTPGYFQAMGMPVLRGRGFDARDDEGAPTVAIIDETLAATLWPEQDPLGRRIAFEQHDPAIPRVYATVVGTVGNIRHYELESPSRPQVYVPYRQTFPLGLSVVIRHAPGAGAAASDRLRRVVTTLEPGVAITAVRPLEDVVAERLGPGRALGALTGVFATFALLLSALGIFGALSLAVARRRRELGVRLAVGATPRGVLALIGRYGLALGAVGSAIGIAAALAASRVLASLLFDVRPFDPAVYAAVTAALLLVAAGAALAPALRAAKVEPARVLREE